LALKSGAGSLMRGMAAGAVIVSVMMASLIG
jgi:hypothetical protein